jgi:hypothetical protein
MRKFIENLQQKDEAIKKQILMFSLIVSMIIVISIWFYQVLSPRQKIVKINQSEKSEETINPVKAFSGSLSQAIQGISASVGNISIFSKEPKQIDLEIINK